MSGRMEKVMRLMAERQATDVFLSANMPILIKIDGQMLQLSDQVLTPMQPRQLLAEVLSPLQLEELDDTGELNLAVPIPLPQPTARIQAILIKEIRRFLIFVLLTASETPARRP